MRLLHTTGLYVETMKQTVPRYAILSHTWDDTELSLQDLASQNCRSKPGYSKVQQSCEKARDQNSWIWIDTCCIDRTSSAELSESINSMYRWYEEADVCHVYLADFEGEKASLEGLKKCKWFFRGWTLQELLAPSNVIFWNKNWTEIGSKQTLANVIAAITTIPLRVLQCSSPLHCTVAQRLSWASARETTRSEDIAYSLLGLFDVQMVPVYGEGSIKAFIRLQLQILRRWNDHSIFIWTPSHEPRNLGLLPTSPKPFCKHKECFGWLHKATDLSQEDFDPYEHFLPAHYASRASRRGSYVYPVSQHSSRVLYADNEGPTINLGPQGLQVSLLLSEKSIDFTGYWHDLALIKQGTEVCLDLCFRKGASSADGAYILLPLMCDLQHGTRSQDINRRGLFCRFPAIDSRNAEYRFTGDHFSFWRQPVRVSQQDPIPKSGEEATFAFTTLPTTAKLVENSIHSQTQQRTTVDIASPLRCRGGICSFSHSFPGAGCENIPFFFCYGTHGSKPTPWCCIRAPGDIWYNNEWKSPQLREYELIESMSTRYKNTYYGRLSCGHVVHAVVLPDPHAGNSPGFNISLIVFQPPAEEDLRPGSAFEKRQ